MKKIGITLISSILLCSFVSVNAQESTSCSSSDTSQKQEEKRALSPQEYRKWQAQKLIDAVKKGNFELVKTHLDEGALMGETDANALSAFQWAAIKGDKDIMTLLLDELERNTPAQTPMPQGGILYIDAHYLALRELKAHQKRIVRLLKEDAFKTKYSCDVERQKNQIESLSKLQGVGNLGSILRAVIWYREAQLYRDQCLMRECALGDNTNLVAELLKSGANPYLRNRNGETLLHKAACNGHASIVKLLLAAGCDVNATDWDFGHTPLHSACLGSNLDCASLLLQAGAHLDREKICGHNRTPDAFLNDEEIGPFTLLLAQTVLMRCEQSKEKVREALEIVWNTVQGLGCLHGLGAYQLIDVFENNPNLRNALITILLYELKGPDRKLIDIILEDILLPAESEADKREREILARKRYAKFFVPLLAAAKDKPEVINLLTAQIKKEMRLRISKDVWPTLEEPLKKGLKALVIERYNATNQG